MGVSARLYIVQLFVHWRTSRCSLRTISVLLAGQNTESPTTWSSLRASTSCPSAYPVGCASCRSFVSPSSPVLLSPLLVPSPPLGTLRPPRSDSTHAGPQLYQHAQGCMRSIRRLSHNRRQTDRRTDRFRFPAAVQPYTFRTHSYTFRIPFDGVNHWKCTQTGVTCGVNY